jgi:putative cardiolipin synthase
MVPGLLLSTGCATLPTGFDKPPSHAFTDTHETLLGRVHREELMAHPGHSGFLLLADGLDAFVARAALARYAERSIDVQYYLYHDDLVGALLTDALLKAADRGVRVRVLVDDMGIAGRDLGASVLDSHPNLEVRIFNPFSRKTGRLSQFVTRWGSVTRRMHNKSFTVDNQVAVLGGRNVGNEYFEADPTLAFADLDVLCVGPVAKEVSEAFDLYWNSELTYPATALRGEAPTPGEARQKRQEWRDYVAHQADSDYLKALRESSLAARIRADQVRYAWGEARVIYDRPEKILHAARKEKYHLGPQIKPYFEGVQKELIIFSPYFVPGREGTALLAELAQRGVRVRILTNSLASTDVGIVHAGYSKYRRTLLRAGVELYEMNKRLTREQRKEKRGKGGSTKASLHAKSFVFDRREVFIGSLNLDPRSLTHNTEIGVVLSSPAVAILMSDWFDRNIGTVAFRLELTRNWLGARKILWHGVNDGKERTFTVDPYTGFWRRLGIDLLRVLPIESQL